MPIQTARITDHRKEHEKKPLGFVLARFEPTSGDVDSKMFLALAFDNTRDAGVVAANAYKRMDVLSVEIVEALPELTAKDEITIVGRDYAQTWYELPRYKCASPNCPGYLYRASERAHPAETCGSSEKKAS